MKILIYDIETAPAIGLFFGKPYDVQIAKIIQHEYVLGFSYKWLGEKKVHTCYIWDFPRYKKEPTNEIEVIKKWCELVSEADVLVGHNSDRFDYRQMFARVMLHQLPPVSEPQMVDTKKAVKRVAEFASYKLDELGDRFGLGRKMAHSKYRNPIDLWWACMNGEKDAMNHMVKYNRRDVTLTEDLYLYERPYMKSHPNMATITDRPEVCPKCGVKAKMESRGWRYTKTGKYRKFQCHNCFSFVSERTVTKIERPNYV